MINVKQKLLWDKVQKFNTVGNGVFGYPKEYSAFLSRFFMGGTSTINMIRANGLRIIEHT